MRAQDSEDDNADAEEDEEVVIPPSLLKVRKLLLRLIDAMEVRASVIRQASW